MLDRIDTTGSKDLATKLKCVVQGSTSRMCRGMIGGTNGTRFCSRIGCSTVSHKQHKVILNGDRDRFYICGVRGDQLFTEPHIPVDWIPNPTDRELLESSEKPYEIWKLFFKRLESIISDNNSGQVRKDTFDPSKELSHIETANVNLKTPKRPIVTRLSDIMETSVATQATSLPKCIKLVRFTDAIKTEDTIEAQIAKFGTTINQWNEIRNQVETVQLCYDSRAKDDQTFKEKLISSNYDLQVAINNAEDMGRILQEEIGKPSIELHGMSVWEGLEKLVFDGNALNEGIQSLKSKVVSWEDIKDVVNDINVLKMNLKSFDTSAKMYEHKAKKFQAMENNLIKFKDHYLKSYSQVKSSLEALGRSSNQASGVFNFNPPGQRQESQNVHTGINSRLTKLDDTISNIHTCLTDLENSLRSEGTMTDMEKLNARVREIESRVSGDSCSINHGEFIFTSVTEVSMWLEKEEVGTVGIFWDIFSALVAMSPKLLTGKERADQQYSSDRINTTNAENELAATMSYERPQTLYGDKNGNLLPWEEGFGSCKTHEKWIIGTQSFKSVTTKQLKKFINGILGSMTPGGTGNSLARVLLNEVS